MRSLTCGVLGPCSSSAAHCHSVLSGVPSLQCAQCWRTSTWLRQRRNECKVSYIQQVTGQEAGPAPLATAAAEQQDDLPSSEEQSLSQGDADSQSSQQMNIRDRLNLVRTRMAQRQVTSSTSSTSSRGSRKSPQQQQFSSQPMALTAIAAMCEAAGLSQDLTASVLSACSSKRLSRRECPLTAYLPRLQDLVAAYGEDTVLLWLKRAPGIIRRSNQVRTRGVLMA